ncbi:MAG TPA: acyltransferase [Acidisarcina sp.]
MSTRIVQLDGLRAIAFFLVVLRHLGYLPGGWMGVDIFFVLSGFLITSILRRSASGDHPLRDFYGKRVRRILPPYIICLTFVALFLTVDWRHVWFLYALPLENLATLFHNGQSGPLAPLWSLGIEEQFYLVWPFLIFNCSRKTLLRVIVGVLVLSPLLRVAFTPFVSSFWIFYELTFFRLDAISLGALMALLAEHPGTHLRMQRYGMPVALAGLAVLVLGNLFGFNQSGNTYLYNGFGYTVIALMSAGLLLWATVPGSILSYLLSNGWLRYVGRISYMAYLIHWPMMMCARHIGEVHRFYRGRLLEIASVPFTLLFATITWYAIERPILQRKRQTRPAPASAPGV